MRVRPTYSSYISSTPVGPAAVKSVQVQNVSSSAVPAADNATILGLAAADLPPNVQAAFRSLLEEIGRLKQELDINKRRVAELERLADEDTLLPLMNRRAFIRELTRFLAFAERYGIAGTLLYVDLNGMKRVNDELGHAAGDALLLHFTEILKHNVRESDVLGRLGGDEFGIILAQADHYQAKEKAKELFEEIERSPLQWEGKTVPISCAIGIHQLVDAKSADQALDEADKAMYQEKRRRYNAI